MRKKLLKDKFIRFDTTVINKINLMYRNNKWYGQVVNDIRHMCLWSRDKKFKNCLKYGGLNDVPQNPKATIKQICYCSANMNSLRGYIDDI